MKKERGDRRIFTNSRALLIVLFLLLAGCGGSSSTSPVIPRPEPEQQPPPQPPEPPEPEPQPPEPEPEPEPLPEPPPKPDPRLALAIGINEIVDYSATQALTRARAPSVPFDRWPEQYQYEQTARFRIRKDSYDNDRNSATPKLPAPCTDPDPPDPCAQIAEDGNYEIELRFSGLFKLAEMESLTLHGTLVARTALRTATTLGPAANYLIRSLPYSGGAHLFTLLEQERATFDTLSFPQFSSNQEAASLAQALRDLGRNAWMSSHEERVNEPDFAFQSRHYPVLAQAGLRIFNHSFLPNELHPYLASPTQYQTAIDNYARSVSLGSVHVWAAGNGYGREPVHHAMLPLSYPQLEQGWLAVVAVSSRDGAIFESSNYCGAASTWCIAAVGTYNYASGTSYAAPAVAGGIAALKARFPNLTPQQIRARILRTADRTGIYSDSAVYGQGRFDFDAASRAVGSLLLPRGASADGPVSRLAGATLRLVPGLAARFAGRRALALDSYQRAPFLIDLGSLARNRPGPGVSALDLAAPLLIVDAPSLPGRALAVRASGEGHLAHAYRWSDAALGFGSGTRALHSLGTVLAGPDLVVSGRYRLSPDAFAAGFALSGGPFGSRLVMRMALEPPEARREPVSGLAGQAPGAVFAGSLLSPSGINSLGFSFASDLASPAGVSGAGAFAVSGEAFDVEYGHRIVAAGPWSLTGRGRVSVIEFDDASLVSADRALVVGMGVEGGYAFAEHLSLGVRLEAEREKGGGEVKVHLASSVDEAGTLIVAPVGLPHRETLDRHRATLFVRYGSPDVPGLSWAIGGLVERDAFGETASVVGAQALLRF